MASTNENGHSAPTPSHRYPWWLAFLLTCPVRRLFEDPKVTLRGLIKPGQVVLELGPGNGFYSVYIASALGDSGKLIAVDIQPQMLKMLTRRLQSRGLDRVLTTRLSGPTTLGLGDLAGTVDMIVVVNVLHEMPNPRQTLCELAKTLRDQGQLLLVEPRGHVSPKFFETELGFARDAGLTPQEQTRVSSTGRSCLLERLATSRA